jgi:hypothetical protein
MNALGWDATHDNVLSIPHNAAVVMGYDTGTPDIRWTPNDWGQFPTTRKVHIDQGGIGSKVNTATVRDVETGAWTPEAAVIDTKGWDAERPTIYCNQNTLPRVLAAGWHGDLWLAIPSNIRPTVPPVVEGCTVVAVQFDFAGPYDRSVVFDDTWPREVPPVTGTMFPEPTGFTETATVDLKWAEVPPINGVSPTGYTVILLGLDGKEYFRDVTTGTSLTVSGLHTGWTYVARVWANGGEIAPPHAEIQVHT